MGFHRHHAIVITSWDEASVLAAHAEASAIFPEAQVSPVTPHMVNGYRSFFIAPDGSKEGWAESDEGDASRQKFMVWLRGTNGYLSFAEIAFGGDEPDHLQIVGPYGGVRCWEDMNGDLTAQVVTPDA